MRWFFIIFFLLPALEMYTLIEVGKVLGSVFTVFLVFMTAVVGAFMLRAQGLSTLLSFNNKVKSGEVPAKEVVSAALLAFSGVLLLLPGFLTDSMGFLLLIPMVRHVLAKRIVAKGVFTVTREFEESRVYAFFNENFRQGEVYEARRREETIQEGEKEPESPMLPDESTGPDSDELTPEKPGDTL